MNTSIKNEIRKKGLKQWQVAEAIGISERTLIVWLRTELNPERKNKVIEAIKKLSERGPKNA